MKAIYEVYVASDYEHDLKKAIKARNRRANALRLNGYVVKCYSFNFDNDSAAFIQATKDFVPVVWLNATHVKEVVK